MKLKHHEHKKKKEKKMKQNPSKRREKKHTVYTEKKEEEMADVFFHFFGIGKIAKRKTQETSCKVVVNYYCYLVVFDVIL
jgi:hypothetical protein